MSPALVNGHVGSGGGSTGAFALSQRRGPIAAEFQGPGPAAVALPSTIGKKPSSYYHTLYVKTSARHPLRSRHFSGFYLNIVKVPSSTRRPLKSIHHVIARRDADGFIRERNKTTKSLTESAETFTRSG